MLNPYRTLHWPCFDCLRRYRSGGRGICWACSESAEAALVDLVDDFDDLSAVIGMRGRTPDGVGIHATKPRSAPPINLLIDELRSRLVYSAAVWEEIVRDHCGLSVRGPGAVRERWSLLHSVSILAPRVDVLVTLAEVDGYFDGDQLEKRTGMDGLTSLVRMHHTVGRVLGVAAVVVRLPGECPKCSTSALRREIGSDTVWCAGCSQSWTYADYTLHARLLIGDL